MSHYYLNDDNLKDNIKTIEFTLFNQKYMFKTNDGVFSKNRLDFGSKLLIESVLINEDIKEIADIGSGYGPIGITLAKVNPNVNFHLYEINKKAIELAYQNKKINQVNNVFIYENNALDDVNKTFDLIVTNPPIRAGKDVVFKFYEQAHKCLNKGGFLYVVIQKKQGAESTFNKLTLLFENVNVLTKKSGYWIVRAQKYNIDWLLTNYMII